MELDEEPEDAHGHQPSGFLNSMTLPKAKGYPSYRFPNLYGMVTHIEILRDSHQGIFRVRAPPGHQRSPDQHRRSTTIVTMASHTGISVYATLGVVISSLDYTQNYQASAPLKN